ncbi:OmpA family protein [uncultured Azohydromonas sp.]|jgi:Flagellar motor protein|uniref:OmpA/MotB family protein n=1 Tax=uncultured Azohydromonas sp. TaxID=487342 RepID=UPI00263436D0|nr:OmpA family protein [uncultured Azohydromonas sp.]
MDDLKNRPARPAPTASPAPAEAPHWSSGAVLSSWTPKQLHADEESGSERWLISYADFITLLMVLFMMLYALQLVKNKDVPLANLRSEEKTHAASPDTQPNQPPALDDRSAGLEAQLKSLHDRGEIKLLKAARGMEIEINARLLFNSGDARLLPAALPVLKNILEALNKFPRNHILVEGHTDSQPISNSRFESNWELSSARAGAVVRYFVDHGIERHRLAAMGRADNVPAALGTTPEAMAVNRRVTVLVQY